MTSPAASTASAPHVRRVVKRPTLLTSGRFARILAAWMTPTLSRPKARSHPRLNRAVGVVHTPPKPSLKNGQGG